MDERAYIGKGHSTYTHTHPIAHALPFWGTCVLGWCWDSAMRGTFIKSGCKVAVKRRPGKMVWFQPFTTGRCGIEQMPPCFGKTSSFSIFLCQEHVISKYENLKTWSWYFSILNMCQTDDKNYQSTKYSQQIQSCMGTNNQTLRIPSVANLTVAGVRCNRSGRNPAITKQRPPPPAGRFPGCSL